MWTRHSEERFSGKPLAPFVNERHGEGDRTEHGFFASPVIADLDGDGRPEVVLAGGDRHMYAWHGDGSAVAGFPFLVVDRSKVESIDPQSEEVTFKPDAGALMQGKIVDTPAVGDIDGDGRPEIVVGTNEEYAADKDGGLNAGSVNTTSLSLLGQTGVLNFANSRVYAFEADGSLVKGWPAKVGIINAELLPDVGEGITGSPVLAKLTCPSGGTGVKVGVIPDAGPGYLFNADGTSCHGQSGGHDNALSTDVSAGVGQVDHPVFPAVGLPAFGDLGGLQPSFVAPVAGLLRALDLVVPDYQVGGQDFTAAWDPATGQMRPGFPAQQNDLAFLTGPSVADIDGLPGEEIVAGTASLDLQAFNALGRPVSSAWPKLTGDWTVATPLIGSFGDAPHKSVVNLTRLGGVFVYDTSAPVCSPSSSPRFHHDPANSGDYARDAVPPGKPQNAKLVGGTLTVTAPGDDLLCGTADHYEVLGSSGWTTSPVKPAAAGTAQAIPVGANARSVSVRAVDEAGNVGRPVVVRR
ncbi:MAG: VCBS repeat-containing protein [Actinobacteria bacterium]|nr:MAG: VCBS repeat-containing protein [Actinomycetota bacterium]